MNSIPLRFASPLCLIEIVSSSEVHPNLELKVKGGLPNIFIQLFGNCATEPMLYEWTSWVARHMGSEQLFSECRGNKFLQMRVSVCASLKTCNSNPRPCSWKDPPEMEALWAVPVYFDCMGASNLGYRKIK